MNGVVLTLALLAGTGLGLPNDEQTSQRTTTYPSALGETVAPRDGIAPRRASSRALARVRSPAGTAADPIVARLDGSSG